MLRPCCACIHEYENVTIEPCYSCVLNPDKPAFKEKESNPITNADRVRAMTDEELADFLQDVAMQGGIELGGRLTTWLDWLKQEAEE